MPSTLHRPSTPIVVALAVLSIGPASLALARSAPVGRVLSSSFPSGGLLNLGNTCYLNSQLECAYHVPLVRDLVTDPPLAPGSIAPASPALKSLGDVFKGMEAASQRDGGGQAVSTAILCRTMGIPVWEQQDAQEFWKLLLPEVQLPRLLDLYRGSYEGYIAALDGSERERKREEKFLDLSLEVSSGSLVSSVEDMFCKPELLSKEEGNGWRPERGADKVDALKGSLLRADGLPSLLQLHLMRFKYDWRTDSMSKINDRFKFPRRLDLSSICTDHEGDGDVQGTEYELQSVVVHMGGYGSGHYYAYVRPDVRRHIWYRFDDDKVSEVTYREVVADAYGGQSRNKDVQEEQKGFIARLFGGGATGGRFGWGGRTSSAYMLQYVKRSDIPTLFGEE